MKLTLFSRCALAIAAMHAVGCEERERWPEPKRVRDKPRPVVQSDAMDCNHGQFCLPVPEHVRVGASAPYEQCSAFVAIPDDVATEVSADLRPTLRVRFNADETERSRADDPDACCYTWFEHCRGRPLVVNGEVVLGDVVPRDDWQLPRLDVPRCANMSASWQREAAHEHASAAAFVRLAQQLMALRAPHELIAEAARSAEEEWRHARIAFAIASAYAGRSLGPAPTGLPHAAWPSRSELAAASYLEGCVAETVSAVILRRALEQMSPPVRALMRRVLTDEERHAAFSFRVTAWCMREPSARGAVERVAGRVALPTSFDPAPSYGVMSATERRREAERALELVVRPLTRRLLERRLVGAERRASMPRAWRA